MYWGGGGAHPHLKKASMFLIILNIFALYLVQTSQYAKPLTPKEKLSICSWDTHDLKGETHVWVSRIDDTCVIVEAFIKNTEKIKCID